MKVKSNIIKSSPSDKQKAIDVLNEIKDKPLLAGKMEALTDLFENVTVANSSKA